MSSSFSQRLMRYHFSCDVYAIYWMCLTVRKMKPHLKFLERSGRKSPLPLCAPTLNNEQKWILFFYRYSATHPTHFLRFSMGAGLPRTGMGPTAELINEHQDISQCLHPTVSHLKRISMGHISKINQAQSILLLLEVRGWTTGCLKFLTCKSAIWYQHH